ncbi:MAG: HD-GYP domain-containing protein, partial [Lachnospiraceae bacterium]|nr:HD-GYP domain-containing protein [Lachnospiraceae bacterium]
MRKLLVSDLKNGMITGEDVFSTSGQLVVPKGVALTQNLIARMISFNVFSIRIEDEALETVVEKLDEQRSYVDRLKNSQEFLTFKKDYSHAMDNVEFGLNALIARNEDYDPRTLLDSTMDLISSRKGSGSIMDMILNMHDFDDCTYSHSINVAMICNIFADWLRFSEEERNLATACGLFHDIGKLNMPKEIINKPGKLTNEEYRIIKTHPLESYKLLSELDLPEEIKNAALMHHERCDGSGYPYGFTGDKISKMAKLVAIADVYDAMTSNRSYRDALCPFTVITTFEDDGLQKYDPKFLLTFLENVVNTFVNQTVRLSNGLEGRIIFINPVSLTRPTI